MRDLIIVGGGPGGLSAAIYAKRAMLDSAVIEKEFSCGGQIILTDKVDNYLGMPGVNGFDMGMRFKEHADALGVEFINDEVVTIENVPEGNYKKIHLKSGDTIETKTVIIATGTKHKKLGVPGEAEFAGMGVSYCATCDGAFFRGKDVAVVGGGNIALQDALYLARLCNKVYLIHRRDGFRGERALGQQVLDNEKIEFLPFSELKNISGEAGTLTLAVANNQTNEETALNVAGCFIAIGMEAVSGFAKDICRMDDAGFIIAGEDCISSDSAVFAVGDGRTKKVRQLATAVGDGATAIAMVEAYLNN